jgi:hypothetical protein
MQEAQLTTIHLDARPGTVRRFGRDIPCTLVFRDSDQVGHVRKLDGGGFRWVADGSGVPHVAGDCASVLGGVDMIADVLKTLGGRP